MHPKNQRKRNDHLSLLKSKRKWNIDTNDLPLINNFLSICYQTLTNATVSSIPHDKLESAFNELKRGNISVGDLEKMSDVELLTYLTQKDSNEKEQS